MLLATTNTGLMLSPNWRVSLIYIKSFKSLALSLFSFSSHLFALLVFKLVHFQLLLIVFVLFVLTIGFVFICCNVPWKQFIVNGVHCYKKTTELDKQRKALFIILILQMKHQLCCLFCCYSNRRQLVFNLIYHHLQLIAIVSITTTKLPLDTESH